MATSMPELFEDPSTGALLPMRLPGHEEGNPKSLIGTAVRYKRVAFVDVQIYVLGVYASPQELLGSLGVGPTVEHIMKTVFKSNAEKVFSLTFMRALPSQKVVETLIESLCGLGGVAEEEARKITPLLPSSIERGTQALLLINSLSGEISVGDLVVHCPDVISGLHRLYFGTQPVVVGFKASVEARLHALQAELVGSSVSASSDSLSGGESTESDSNWVNDGSSHTACVKAKPPIESRLPRIMSAEMQTFGNEASQPVPPASRSWKESSGRMGGPDAYKFGDLTRSLVRNIKKPTDASAQGPPWPGALVVEMPSETTEENEIQQPLWVQTDSVPELNVESAAEQRLQGVFYKHHTSLVRGRVLPQWSLRHFELTQGVLRSRRHGRSKSGKALPLTGMRIVAEKPRLAASGDCYVFRVVRHFDGAVCARLSSPDMRQATEWVRALAAVCASNRSQQGEEEEDVVAPEVCSSQVVPPASETSLPQDAMRLLSRRLSHHEQPLAALSRRFVPLSMGRRALLSVLAAVATLLLLQRLRRRLR
jgi:hypothetical protein